MIFFRSALFIGVQLINKVLQHKILKHRAHVRAGS